MDDDFEMLEFQFPSVFPVGTYVKIVKVVPHPARVLKGNVVGKSGIVHSHRTHHQTRWHRLQMDGGGSLDFTTQELQKIE